MENRVQKHFGGKEHSSGSVADTWSLINHSVTFICKSSGAIGAKECRCKF